MINLLRAELIKIIKNYKLTTFLVWIFPIGTAAAMTILIISGLIIDDSGPDFMLSQWTSDMMIPWRMIIKFPGNIFSRILPISFMAVVFAGEYQWSTWKNILPRKKRAPLILGKLIALTSVITFSLILMSLVIVTFQSILYKIEGVVYSPELTREVLGEFACIYLKEAFIAIISLLLLGTFASLAAVMTRSILGSLLLSMGFSIFDLLWLPSLYMLGLLFKKPEMINLFRFTPLYNLENVQAWLVDQNPYALIPPGFTAELSLTSSFLVLGAWLLALTGLTLWVFQRQDITS